jgi:hypothetical protein
VSLQRAFLIFRSSECCWIADREREKSCAILSIVEQQELIEKIKRLPQDRVAEVESFVDSLARREHSRNRMNLHQALTDYAIQHAGTDADIDTDLEVAATDHLLQQDSEQ